MIIISIKNLSGQEQHSHAHKLLRECLKPLNIAYSANTPITKGKYGKPSLTDYPEVCFNVSHADDIAACIVTGSDCGIDCERVREYRPNVMKRAFTDNERQLVLSAREADRDMLFFRLWTLKEAYIKAIGMGLSYPMNKAEFSFENGGIASNITDFTFKQYIIKNGQFVVSICTKKAAE